MPSRRSVAVLVFAPDPLRVLLLRRPAHRAAGWQSVSGRVEPEDGPEGAPDALRRACLREIHEETGLPPPDALLDLGHEVSFLSYDSVAYHQRHFAARYADAIPVPHTPEHEEGRWVEADAARALLTWEPDRQALEILRAQITPAEP